MCVLLCNINGHKLQRNYVRDYLKQRELLHPIENTSEMTISKMIAPLISQKAYSLDARRVMQKYNLDAGKNFSGI